MTLKLTKERLIKLLSQSDNKVIAVSGKWGTGKTFLWNEVKSASEDDAVKESLYVSLFGLSSVDQIKRKLIENSLLGIESNNAVLEGLKNIVKTGISAGSAHFKSLAAFNDLNVLLLAPAVLRGKVIVIDGIERKNDKLSIDELLGFIDEHSKQYNSRFVLVLNDDQLSTENGQNKLWTTFREKVIDQEIRLQTSPQEAFKIAEGLVPTNYAQVLERAVTICGLTNIRIVSKIIRLTNELLQGQDLSESIQVRVIPSIVLFAGIHFRGLENGPDLQFALHVNDHDWLALNRREVSPGSELATGLEDAWHAMMFELGIYRCDEFELQLVNYLGSGLFDAEQITQIIARYKNDASASDAEAKANSFLRREFWDHNWAVEEVLGEAQSLVGQAALLKPYVVTQVANAIEDCGKEGKIVSDTLVDAWIAAYINSDQSGTLNDNPFNNPLHPKIQAALEQREAENRASASLFDACMTIIQNDAWGPIQEAALNKATSASFESIIREMTDYEVTIRFMTGMKRLRRSCQSGNSPLTHATKCFMDACSTIRNDSQIPRLSRLIKRLFANTALASELSSIPSSSVDSAVQ